MSLKTSLRDDFEWSSLALLEPTEVSEPWSTPPVQAKHVMCRGSAAMAPHAGRHAAVEQTDPKGDRQAAVCSIFVDSPAPRIWSAATSHFSSRTVSFQHQTQMHPLLASNGQWRGGPSSPGEVTYRLVKESPLRCPYSVAHERPASRCVCQLHSGRSSPPVLSICPPKGWYLCQARCL